MREGTVKRSGGFRSLALVAAAAATLFGAGQALAGAAPDIGADTVGCFNQSVAGTTTGRLYFAAANTPTTMVAITPWIVFGASSATPQVPVSGKFGGANASGVALYSEDGNTGLWTAASDLGAVDGDDALSPSNYYALPINNAVASTTRPIPLAGNFIGNGNPGVALYYPDTGAFVIDTNPGSATLITPFLYGPATPGNVVPLVGDWNGDGIDTVGVYVQSTSVFHLTDNISNPASVNAAPVNKHFKFGAASNGFIPIVGDWDLQGGDSIGFYDPATGLVRLRNTNDAGLANVKGTFAAPDSGCQPIAGNWNLAPLP